MTCPTEFADVYLPNCSSLELLFLAGVLREADDRLDHDLARLERLLAAPLPTPREEEDLPDAKLLVLPDKFELPRDAGTGTGNKGVSMVGKKEFVNQTDERVTDVDRYRWG